MCGRFAQQRPAADLAELFGAELLIEEPGERPNVAPTDEALVVVERDDRRALVAFRWGLVPHWADSARIGSRAFNARLERIDRAPVFRDSFRRHRCLVPVDAFYEWRRDAGRSVPFAIERADGQPLALAGLWAGWRDPAGGAVRRTFTIITAPADERIADLHDRMPVILPPGTWDVWLDPSSSDPARLRGLLEAMDPVPLTRRQVAPLGRPVGHPPVELLLPLEPASPDPGLRTGERIGRP
jgi:putative SOS response-associated peptidase YedK